MGIIRGRLYLVYIEMDMKASSWPIEPGGYRRIPAPTEWLLYNIEIKQRPPKTLMSLHLDAHYILYNDIVKWMYDNISKCLPDKVWWDIDGDRMYFAFSEPAHYTWFILRWA